MVPTSPSGSRTLEPYESPTLLPRHPKVLGARFREFDPRGLLASTEGGIDGGFI